VRAFDLGFGNSARTTTILVVVLGTIAPRAVAQVGLSSHSQAVTLVARVPVRASLSEVNPLREKISGLVRETSVTLGVGTNAGYRLVVKAATSSGSRTWVRGTDGQFHELVAGEEIIVAQDPAGNGEREQEIQYRVESSGMGRTEVFPPVRCDIVVNPTL
jgi:hypothetical protein